MAVETSRVKKIEDMKVAIVCDWLTGIGGAERVVLELHKMFPSAPIYTSQFDPNKIDWFKDADVRTGWLQKLPTSLKKFLPVLRAIYFSNLNLDKYDLVISSSGAEAKGIKTGKNTIHISYIHSPTHYYWSRYEDYLKNPGFGVFDWLARIGLKALVGPMRMWDKKAATRPNYLIANSNHTKNMIKKYYDRDSEVIFPPVDTERFKNSSELPRKGFLIAGRQTPYKRFDLAVQACTDLSIPLTVIGDGPENDNLRSIAGDTINFVKQLNDDDIVKYFVESKAFIFPGLDDFGIVAVESLSAGTPVIAYKDGGALDYIDAGINGVFFNDQRVESLSDALIDFQKTKFNPDNIRQSSNKFNLDSFKKNIKSFIQEKIN